MDSNRLDVLAFSPHPDDVEIGCGGTLVRAAEQGLRVGVADLSAGERGSRGTSEERSRERAKAGDILGLADRFCLGLPDTEIGLQPEQRMPVIEIIRQTRPRIVLLPYRIERHPDHECASRLVRHACFVAGMAKVGPGQPHRPRFTYYYMIHTPFAPSFVVDVSSVWERRMAALRAYATQVTRDDARLPATPASAPEFLDYIEARGVYFGAMIGVARGEGFLSSAPIPSTGLPGIDGNFESEQPYCCY